MHHNKTQLPPPPLHQINSSFQTVRQSDSWNVNCFCTYTVLQEYFWGLSASVVLTPDAPWQTSWTVWPSWGVALWLSWHSSTSMFCSCCNDSLSTLDNLGLTWSNCSLSTSVDFLDSSKTFNQAPLWDSVKDELESNFWSPCAELISPIFGVEASMSTPVAFVGLFFVVISPCFTASPSFPDSFFSFWNCFLRSSLSRTFCSPPCMKYSLMTSRHQSILVSEKG